MILNLHEVARAIFEANRDYDQIEAYGTLWPEVLPSGKQVYLNIASDVLAKLHLSYVVNPPGGSNEQRTDPPS